MRLVGPAKVGKYTSRTQVETGQELATPYGTTAMQLCIFIVTKVTNYHSDHPNESR